MYICRLDGLLPKFVTCTSDAALADGAIPANPIDTSTATPTASSAISRLFMPAPAFLHVLSLLSVGGEVLVGAWGVLARPLVELLAGVAAGAVHVQAQPAAGVLEFPGAVGLLRRFPQAAGRAADGFLDHVRGALRGGVAGHGHVVAGVLRLQLAVPAGNRDELELLVGLPVTGPLIDRRPGRGGVPEHVQAQGIAGDHQPVITGREPAAGAADRPGERRGSGGAGAVPGGDGHGGGAGRGGGAGDQPGRRANGQPGGQAGGGVGEGLAGGGVAGVDLHAGRRADGSGLVTWAGDGHRVAGTARGAHQVGDQGTGGMVAVNEPLLTAVAACAAILAEELVRYGVTLALLGVPVPDSE